jgi:hypothetical protein
MPENIVKDYRHLYEDNNYMGVHRTLAMTPHASSSVTVKAFGVRNPEFPEHYICVTLQRHRPEFFAVTNVTKINEQVHAQVSVDNRMLGLKQSWRKMHLAYEWLHVMLTFCGRGYGDLRWTLRREVKDLLYRLSERSEHCKSLLSEFNLKIHKALRILLVSNEALQQVLLRISFETSNNQIVTLEDLRSFMETDYTKAYNTITWPFIQRFALDQDVEEDIMWSRLQEELNLCQVKTYKL